MSVSDSTAIGEIVASKMPSGFKVDNAVTNHVSSAAYSAYSQNIVLPVYSLGDDGVSNFLACHISDLVTHEEPQVRPAMPYDRAPDAKPFSAISVR